MRHNSGEGKTLLKYIILCLFIGIGLSAYGQINTSIDSPKEDSLRAKLSRAQMPSEDMDKQYDVGNLIHAVLHPRKKVDASHHGSGIVVVPNVAANPTIGLQGGIKAVAGKKLGDDPNTLFSVAATSASVTTKGIISFYLNHNVFTPGNKWNLQGNLSASKSVVPDYGIGIGRDYTGKGGSDSVLADPTHKVYSINSFYFVAREKVYKNIAKDLFVGAGLSMEYRTDIKNKDTVNNATPSSVYNNEHGFPQNHYSTVGFLFNVEYTTRDNPNRAYRGFYFDGGIRINQTWIGSTKNAVQLTSDIRKYVSLSSTRPELVLAFWNWGSYLLNGAIPYLELPGTAKDGSFRSGRGYMTQYFKSTKFNDTEAEFRFPITKNNFLSGVVFGNLQTGNDEQGTQLFQVFQPGYGAGLRVLFNKQTRTNLALDYAYGRFGNKGFFLNLNEAF
jgi:hypothetical protein